MASFTESLTTGVTAIISMLKTVTSGLLENELFSFGLAVLITVILINVVASLVRRGRRG